MECPCNLVLVVISFDSISTLAESAGAAFEPFVLKLVKAVADGMRECVAGDRSALDP